MNRRISQQFCSSPKLLLLTVIFLFVSGSASSQTISDKKVTLNSFNPSPHGHYNKFRLYPRAGVPTVPATCEDGTLYFDEGQNAPQYCANSAWSTLLDSVWTISGDHIYLSNLGPDPEKKKVGVGTSNPLFALTIMTDPGMRDHAPTIVAQGNIDQGTLISGTFDDRPYLLWYPRKGAFRAGMFDNISDTSMGYYSTAFNHDTLATGNNSFAIGEESEAQGTSSIAMGYQSEAWGEASLAMGFLSNTGTSGTPDATGHGAIAIGTQANAAADNSIVIGHTGVVIGNNSVLFELDAGSVELVTRPSVMVIDGGNFGIGTTDPQADLEVGGGGEVLISSDADNANLVLKGENSSNAFIISQGGTTNDKALWIGTYNDITETISNPIYLIENLPGTENWKQIGIGTTNPKYMDVHVYDIVNEPQVTLENTTGAGITDRTIKFIDLNSADFQIRNSSTGNFLEIRMDQNSNGVWAESNEATIRFDGDNGHIGSNDGPTIKTDAEIHLQQNGRILIDGTTAARLTIKHDTHPLNDFRWQIPAGGSNDFQLRAGDPGTGWPTEVINFYKDTTLNGVSIGIDPSSPRTHSFYVAGDIIHAGAVCPSSRVLKNNIEDLSLEESLLALNNLEPIKFEYKADETDDLHVGFIAEDVPELLATPDRKGLKQMDLAGFLTKIVQHQQEMIEEQQKEIKKLEKEINNLF